MDEDNDENQLICASLLSIGIALKLKSKKKKIWVKPWLAQHGRNGHYEHVYRTWRESDPDMFRRILRVYPEDFAELVRAVYPRIVKMDTYMRYAIPVDKRVAITLRYLCSGESFVSLHGQFCTGYTTIRTIVKETCRAIIYCLRSYSKTPNTPDEWMAVSDGFWQDWNYPYCIGALDGKHVLVQPQKNSGSHYWNYKKQNSIVLMALVSHDYKILYADVGVNGRISDGGVWNRCTLKKKIFNNSLNIPDVGRIPLHIVGDDAFPLCTRIMKPYSLAELQNNKEKRIFNYRLSRARNKSENAFGILVHRFELFRAPIRTSTEQIKLSTMAAVSLHNWLMTKDGPGPRYGDMNDMRPIETAHGIAGLDNLDENETLTARKMRDILCNFFNNEGAVEWQDEML